MIRSQLATMSSELNRMFGTPGVNQGNAGMVLRLGELAKEKARAVEADRTQRLREAEAARRLSEIEDRLQTAQGSLREANRRVTLLERELASTKSDLAEAQLGLKANTEARTQAKEQVAKMGEEIVQLRTLASQRQDQLDASAASRLKLEKEVEFLKKDLGQVTSSRDEFN